MALRVILPDNRPLRPAREDTMDLAILGTALFTLTVAERFPALRFQRSAMLRPFWRTDVTCLLTGGVALLHGTRTLAAIAAPVDMPWSRTPAWAAVPAAIVLYDLGAYAAHLLLHRVEPLWQLHKVHHSSRTLDWLATFRAHVLEHALRHMLSPVALIVLGFPLATVAIAGAVYTAWAAFGHANVGLRLRALEPLFITPRLHRLHHVPGTSDRNLGTIFSLWDRLRGTLALDPAAPLNPVGVPDEIDTYPQTWRAQLVEPFQRTGRTARNSDTGTRP
jgi:sterol desaturase/sphingolipid hydroxylase (fatty acid hydroxylase superfamily)